jgi:hypothetical protein
LSLFWNIDTMENLFLLAMTHTNCRTCNG